jgi:hypothetical protein
VQMELGFGEAADEIFNARHGLSLRDQGERVGGDGVRTDLLRRRERIRTNFRRRIDLS